MRRGQVLSPLKNRSAFLGVAASGKKWVTPGVIVQIRPMPSLSLKSDLVPLRRFGLTASKRVGNAVQRNRARRRLRALAHEVLASHSLPDYDYVLIARPATVERGFDALRNDLIVSLKRLKAWQETTP